MTERISRLVDAVRRAKAPICTKKFEIASQVIKANRDASPYMKRVLVLEAYLDQMPVFIPDEHLIAGEGASKPFGIELCYEYGMWPEDQLEEMHEECSWCTLEDEDYEFCRQYLLDESKVVAQGLPGIIADYVWRDDSLAALKTSGIGGWKDRSTGTSQSVYGNTSMGHFPNVMLAVPMYSRIISEGARSVIDRCKKQLENADYTDADILEKIDFWNGIIRVYEAWIRFAGRYADLAERMAAECADPVRAAELSAMSAVCRRVPEYPAGTFREALQAFWFTWIMMGSPTNSAGRFDQYMYPFYKADLESGRITPEEALELLEMLKVKSQAFRSVRGAQSRGASSGGANWFNYTIGGVDRAGNDATNDLTYMMIEASRETMLPNHTLTLRVHEGTPDALMQKALELVKTGLGMPAFLSDREYISFFRKHGVSLEDAREYAISGCLDGNIPGKTRIEISGFVGNMQFLDIFLHNGVSTFSGKMAGIQTGDPRDIETFDEFMELFYKQHAYLVSTLGKLFCIDAAATARHYQDPFYSALMEGCLEEGRDLTRRRFEPFDNLIMVSMTGAINLCDALAAIKLLVFEEKKYTMDELLSALDCDWAGYEQMRRDFQNAPKYGNNDDYVDQIVVDYYRRFAEDIEACPHPFGHCIPAGISISMHQMEGRRTPASPEGRKSGEILTDGSISPEHGADRSGPLAVLSSGMKIDQSMYNATLLNLKFHPSAAKTPDDISKLAALTRTYLLNGGKHIQYNIVDRQTLLAAQDEPEAHEDLIVRVAGYSAYFTQLTKLVQNEVIDRTGFKSACTQ